MNTKENLWLENKYLKSLIRNKKNRSVVDMCCVNEAWTQLVTPLEVNYQLLKDRLLVLAKIEKDSYTEMLPSALVDCPYVHRVPRPVIRGNIGDRYMAIFWQAIRKGPPNDEHCSNAYSQRIAKSYKVGKPYARSSFTQYIRQPKVIELILQTESRFQILRELFNMIETHSKLSESLSRTMEEYVESTIDH